MPKWRWDVGWVALMIALVLVGHRFWPDSLFFYLPLVLSGLGVAWIDYRFRRGFWPWSRRERNKASP